VLAIQVLWGRLKAMPKSAAAATLLTLAALKMRVISARRKQQLSDDVTKTEEDVLSYLKHLSTSDHDSFQLRELFKAKLSGSKHQTRFARLVWPHVARRIESNPKIHVRDVAVTHGARVHDKVVYKGNAIE
jgi:hypothetical protein